MSSADLVSRMLPCRPPELLPVLGRHLLPRLSLNAWQVRADLGLACLAADPFAGHRHSLSPAQPGALRFAEMLLHSSLHGPRFWPTGPPSHHLLCAQAQPPASCPAALAHPAQVDSKLDALARVHAGLHRGQCTVSLEACFSAEAIPVAGVEPEAPCCSLSPSGKAAAVFWEPPSTGWQRAHYTRVQGVQMAHLQPDGTWLVQQLQQMILAWEALRHTGGAQAGVGLPSCTRSGCSHKSSRGACTTATGNAGCQSSSSARSHLVTQPHSLPAHSVLQLRAASCRHRAWLSPRALLSGCCGHL